MAGKTHENNGPVEVTLRPVGIVKSEAKETNLLVESGDLHW